MSKKQRIGDLEWVKRGSNEESWWIVIKDNDEQHTMAFTLKKKAKIKEAVKEIMEDYSEDAVIVTLTPYSISHVCPKCSELVEGSENIFELCDECKEFITKTRERVNMSEDEVMQEKDIEKQEALDYLRQLAEKFASSKDVSKLN